MKRIKEVIQLKAIQISKNGFVFPVSPQTRLILDDARGKEKCHQLIYQQGQHYGSVGDCCNYLNDDALAELQEKGMIKIIR